MSKTKPKLIIIDGNALIHRSFHALPPTLRTNKGQLVNAVYGFTSFLLKSLNEFHPEYVVLTLDKKGPTFRHEAYNAYKANRVKAPDELYEQIPFVKKVANAFNIPIFELDGYEADDLIGTICEQTKTNKKLEKIIITGDLDTLQLINNTTKVYTMSRGLSESVLYGADQVKNRYNLAPSQIIDYKALRGDPGDNIPGVKGIGEKTASELLVEFKDLDGVYQAAEKNNPKIRARILELLKENKANAYLSRELATIDLKSPIKFSLSAVEFSAFRLENVLTLFSELGFKSLLNKVKDLRDIMNKAHESKRASLTEVSEISKSSLAEVSESLKSKSSNKNRIEIIKDAANNLNSYDYQLISDDKKFAIFLEKIKKQKEFALSIKTSSPDPLTAEIVGLSFSWKKGAAYFVLMTANRLTALKPILENTAIKKYGHNLKFDWRVLKNHHLDLQGLNFDIIIAAYLLNPANRQLDLETLAFTELGLEKTNKNTIIDSQPAQLTLDFQGVSPEKLKLDACENADLIYQLVNVLLQRLKEENLEELFQKIEMPLISVLGTMENNGIIMKTAPLKKLSAAVIAKLKILEKKIHHLAGVKFNISSTKQLKEILFEKLALSTDNLKKNKTGFSTAEDELIKMHDRHPIIPFIQTYRELNKLQTTYLKALPRMINQKTGRIHTSFNQTITATGRLSSTEPNLQNIPTKTEEGQKIRQAFVAENTYQLVSFDYSQIELRLAAHLSGDQKMIKAFLSNEDIHRATAAEINEVKPEEVTKQMRREAKAINFGIIYGQGPHGLSQSAGISYSRANEFIKKYFIVYPGIKKMMDTSIKTAQKNVYAITLFGRKRPLPEINSSIPAIRRSAERMAINTPLQGTAADLIKMAMIKISHLIKADESNIRMLLQVHDELIFEIKKDKLETYLPQLKKIMETGLGLCVPIIVESRVGQNWGELK